MSSVRLDLVYSELATTDGSDEAAELPALLSCAADNAASDSRPLLARAHVGDEFAQLNEEGILACQCQLGRLAGGRLGIHLKKGWGLNNNDSLAHTLDSFPSRCLSILAYISIIARTKPIVKSRELP